MKKVLFIFLIFCFSLTIISCSSSDEDDIDEILTTDTTAATLAEVTFVTTPTNDSTPNYTFSSDEAGTITYGGSCSSGTTSATSGNNTITLVSLSDGTYSNCTIIVTDSAGNASSALSVSTFVVDTTAPSVSSFTLSDTALITGDNATVTLVFSEAVASFSSSADITVANGTLAVMTSTDNITWAGTFTPTANTEDDNNTLSLATSYTDTAGNTGPAATTLNYVVDTTAPTVSSISPTDNQSSVSITDNITVTFSEAMEPSYVTTSTSDTFCAGTIRLSSDNFSTCVKMSSEPVSSNSNKTFTLDPYDNLTGSTTYKTRVTTGVKDAAGNSMSSQYDNSTGFKTTLLAPDNLTATVGYKQVALAWDNVSSVASSYTVYWDNATGVSKSSTAITNVSDDNYTHTGLTGGATYYYKVAAVNSSGTGALSSEVNATAGAIQYLIGGSMQETELDLSTAVTTLAGSSYGFTDATGTSARFYHPRGITTDGTNLYVADSYNNRIRKIVIDNGTVTTLSGSSYGSTDATGTSARFYSPRGITTDGTNLYVSDYSNHRIRKIVISTGVVTTLAGSSQGSTDATGTSASFNNPLGITTDGTNLYVADWGNHRIRKIVISTGVVTTLAGSSQGSTDATGTSASFSSPMGITTDGTNLYVADRWNHRIRKIVIDNGTVTTLAGSSSSGSTDATGTSASFSSPMGITTDGTNLYVSDYSNHRIRKIVIDNGTVTTLAGSSAGFADNATGTSARFYRPRGITTDGTNLYVADSSNHRIRKIE